MKPMDPGTRPALFSTSAIAEVLGVPSWCVMRVVQRKMVPSVHRLRPGANCIWHSGNIGELVDALKRANYLAADAPVPALTVVDETTDTLAKLAGTRPAPTNIKARLDKLEQES